ncbi:MAG: fumarylacetoacetate hydrolase family protein [Dehalococcoidales bacterium]|nr:fumarylacetoacetate hydrolase family protein [Dehalococcoidales bacterium]
MPACNLLPVHVNITFKMRIVRFSIGKRSSYGILDGDRVESLTGTPFGRFEHTDHFHKLSEVKLLSPCTPSKIVALGLNYRSHAGEMKFDIPDEPLIFLKPSTAVVGPEDKIIPPPSSKRVDYEGELGVVIRDRTSHVSMPEAMSHVLGYTCFNDVTARDLQGKDKQWTRAKSFDTFAAIGPWIETEIDAGDLMLETYLNGEVKQRGRTSDLIFPIPRLISFISEVMTLLPGDVIATGTPEGVGPMKPDDTVEIKIERIGTLRNYLA